MAYKTKINVSGRSKTKISKPKTKKFRRQKLTTQLSRLSRAWAYDPALRGWIVYKAVSAKAGSRECMYRQPKEWTIAARNGNGVLELPEEALDRQAREKCGAGVNFGTLAYCMLNYITRFVAGRVYLCRCLLHEDDLEDTIVPDIKYSSQHQSKGRTCRLHVLQNMCVPDALEQLRHVRCTFMRSLAVKWGREVC